MSSYVRPTLLERVGGNLARGSGTMTLKTEDFPEIVSALRIKNSLDKALEVEQALFDKGVAERKAAVQAAGGKLTAEEAMHWAIVGVTQGSKVTLLSGILREGAA